MNGIKTKSAALTRTIERQLASGRTEATDGAQVAVRDAERASRDASEGRNADEIEQRVMAVLAAAQRAFSTVVASATKQDEKGQSVDYEGANSAAGVLGYLGGAGALRGGSGAAYAQAEELEASIQDEIATMLLAQKSRA